MDDPRILELQELLRKAEERATAGQLALELMHEIRNPLETLGHLNYLAREEASDAEAVRKHLVLAEEQLIQLRDITSQTLGFARTSACTRPICLVVLTEAALRIHQRAIDSKRIHIVRQFPKRLQVSVYRSELLQAVSNLIVNAVEALDPGGHIYVRLRRHYGAVHLMVADNGPGIPKETLNRIFEPFYTTKGERGNGLGLPLTKRIVDHHQGRIRVSSRVHSSRRGTAFCVRLPA